MKKRRVRKTCLWFGEGAREKIFFNFLRSSKKFKEMYAKDWDVYDGHASGQSCRDILIKCINTVSERDYNCVLCFIDTDKLYEDFSDLHEQERGDLEQLAEANNIKIIWQDENHEAELCRATDGKVCKKNAMKGRLQRHENKVINSDFVKKIFKCMK